MLFPLWCFCVFAAFLNGFLSGVFCSCRLVKVWQLFSLSKRCLFFYSSASFNTRFLSQMCCFSPLLVVINKNTLPPTPKKKKQNKKNLLLLTFSYIYTFFHPPFFLVFSVFTSPASTVSPVSRFSPRDTSRSSRAERSSALSRRRFSARTLAAGERKQRGGWKGLGGLGFRFFFFFGGGLFEVFKVFKVFWCF